MLYGDIRKRMALPDILTLSALALSMLSIFSSLRGELVASAVLLFAASSLDYLDGRVARAMKREGRFGVELDNLGDTVLYLVSIAVFGYSAGLKSDIAIAIFVIFVIAGTMRLARFAITGTIHGYYEGIPTTLSLTIPVAYFIFTGYGIDIVYLLYIYLIHALLMVSTIKFRKV